MNSPDLDMMVDCPSHGQQLVRLYDYGAKIGCKECVILDGGPRPMLDIMRIINGMDWRRPDGTLKAGRRT
jgi:hypothetical protein